ncbi:MAG TPA: ergothioneine biosynthesis protein EgtB [Gemmatimonadaceae bacterium]|nr:ergothioneine biosynthesis protein EgtB [Gemmatimonadaceae bacterium]
MNQQTVARPDVERIARLLAEARERTLLLAAPVGDDDLRAQHDPLMGPIVWDLGHIAAFEELWLTRNLDGAIEFSEMPGLYNPFEHPRRVRGALPLPGIAECVAAMEEIRARVLERLESVDLAGGPPLVRGGYVYHMVAQHEYQHNETILQTLQLKRGEPYRAPRAIVPPPGRETAAPGAMARFPGGRVEIGTADRAWAYDNERPRHAVALRPFLIDILPVTNGDYAAFIDAGGYRERRWWSDAGWAWLQDAKVDAPKHWERSGAHGWTARSMDRTAPLDTMKPVCHVCWHEAEAYARWAGKRLPTEYEWEAAASWDPAAGAKRLYPWGDEPWAPALANLDQLAFDTAQVGAYPRNVSPIGCYGMVGDVWEWTATDFGGYPGYESFPYPEYSEAFFGPEYKVLRGGSWATRPGAVRNSFRNWDYPIRRQIFAGFRCARDE